MLFGLFLFVFQEKLFVLFYMVLLGLNLFLIKLKKQKNFMN